MRSLKIRRLALCCAAAFILPSHPDLSAAVSCESALFASAFGNGYPTIGSPGNLTSTAILAPPNEPGTRLIISGIIYQSDGKTPLAYAVLYAYQTDADGYYTREQGGNRNPRLKGRLKAGADGRYEIQTIMPGHYPGSKVPAHIHVSITPAGGKETNIDEFLFDGDPYVTKEDYKKFGGHGQFSSIVKTVSGNDGVLRATRDIVVNPK